jgi:hypothetical protein
MLYVLLKFSQNRPKKILFSSRLKKRPNGQIILLLENCFTKGQMATLPRVALNDVIKKLFNHFLRFLVKIRKTGRRRYDEEEM